MFRFPVSLRAFSACARLFAVFAFSAFVVFPVSGAQAPGKSGSDSAPGKTKPKTADEEWAELKELGKPKKVNKPATKDAAATAKAKKDAADELISEANALRAFRVKHPSHAAAKDAKRQEAFALIHARALGETTQKQRKDQLVGEIRGDASIPATKRAEVAALSDNTEVELSGDVPRDERLARFANTARALAREFPDLPDPYESLLNIARVSDDANAQTLARELLAMSGAPVAVKAEATILLARYTLLGRSLGDLSTHHPGLRHIGDRGRGRPTLIYTWFSGDPASLALAAELGARAPGGVAIVGVCLDVRSSTEAKQVATDEKLPGEQIYDWMGRRGEVAEALQLTEAGLIYLMDRHGNIRSVSAQRDLPAAMALLRTL